MEDFKQFTGLYPLSKTLRFELKPVGKTLENIVKHGLLEEDKHRADSYEKVKKIIDEYHKVFIDNALSDFKLKNGESKKNETLDQYFVLYNKREKDENDKKDFSEIQKSLRKQIVDSLTGNEKYKNIFKKELIKQDLLEFCNEDDRKYVEEFKDFTTYFNGFNENRANMYSAEEQSTAIAYRLIHDNLPKFVDNINTFSKVLAVPEINEKLPKLYKDFESYLNVESISEMFQLDYFNMVLTQKQIDVYNAIIGGKDDGNEKIQGLNEFINLYNQKHKDTRLPKLKVLYKQILSDRNAISWLPEEFKDDNEVLIAINSCYKDLSEHVLGEKNLKILLENISQYQLDGIFIKNDFQLPYISQKLLGNWSVIQNAIIEDSKSFIKKKGKESENEYESRLTEIYKKQNSFSIAYINKCLKNTGKEIGVEDYFSALGAVNTETEQRENLFARISNAYSIVSDLLNAQYPEGRNLSQDKQNVAKIKDLLDALKALQHFIKPLLGNRDESGKDEKFYGEFTALWDELNKITSLYNMVRNYMTRKPYSEEKIKLNFQNSTLMDGWDYNKERDNTAVILRKDGLYYLGIMNKKYNKIFEPENVKHDGECFEKMIYKLLPGANKMLPKVFFSKSRIDEFKPSKEIVENYKNDTHKKGEKFNIEDCHRLIDFFKSSIEKHSDWSKFNFKFSDTSKYADLSGFYREVEHQGYKVTFVNISKDYVNSLVDEGKLYLFLIYNKDFSPYSKGTPNMHTLYWKMLFDERNLDNVVYKLNGQAEIFYRKKSINYDRPTHPAHQPINNKNIQNKKKESLFSYDLIKNRRYTVDKFFFHVPITINFKGVDSENINDQVRRYLQKAKDTHVIGIDRGERNLLYLVVVDNKGNIVEQYSLNNIVNEYKGNTYSTDYHALLDAKEKERELARESWQTIENIKELKEGYLSQVIHKITELMIKYHAIVVLEDLNMGFKRGRQKVEKQVYQKFEKQLIDKLNYVVDKHKAPEADGGLLHAYQLTSKFDSFQKLGKQSGFLFYIPAWNTSKIDPVTGFVNLFDTRYVNIEKAKAFFCKFDIIRYNQDKEWFEFGFDYKNFTSKADESRTKWTLCTFGTRVETFRNKEKNSQWDNRNVDLTKAFKELFSKYNIDLSSNIKEAICIQTEKDFFESLLHLLKLTLQMRNSVTGTEIDYIISPVANGNGEFFDSRTCSDKLPKDADANGAYNIARKGLMLIEQIKKSKDLKKLKFDISNKSWLQYVQNN